MKKKALKHYLKENNIDINDDSFIRYVYIDDEKTNYMVTNVGDVISIRKFSDKKLKPYIDDDGYYQVILYLNGKNHTCRISRLVASAFIYNDDPEHKTQVNHINGDKKDNTISNLEWVTPQRNIQHAWENNLATAKYGDEHPNTVYSDEIIRTICEHFVENKLTMKQIADSTGVPYTIVKQVKNHIIHNDISSQYDFSHYDKSGRNKYCKEQIALAIALINHDYKNKNICDLTGIKEATLIKIKKHKYNISSITSEDIDNAYNEYIKSQDTK